MQSIIVVCAGLVTAEPAHVIYEQAIVTGCLAIRDRLSLTAEPRHCVPALREWADRKCSEPHAPTPFAPTPLAPTPFAPTPFAPTPVAPTPVASTPPALITIGTYRTCTMAALTRHCCCVGRRGYDQLAMRRTPQPSRTAQKVQSAATHCRLSQRRPKSHPHGCMARACVLS